jgi:hypothetical protein
LSKVLGLEEGYSFIDGRGSDGGVLEDCKVVRISRFKPFITALRKLTGNLKL